MEQIKNNKFRTETGMRGETSASNYLVHKGYRIIHRNFHISNIGEIDIITEKNTGFWIFSKKILVFVEVKTIQLKNIKNKVFDPELHIDRRKREKLIKLTNLYMAKNRISMDSAWRIDVVAVEIDSFTGNVLEIRHHENAVHI